MKGQPGDRLYQENQENPALLFYRGFFLPYIDLSHDMTDLTGYSYKTTRVLIPISYTVQELSQTRELLYYID